MTTELKRKAVIILSQVFLHRPSAKGIDYLCVARDLENSIKGVVQRIHKFYTSYGGLDTVMFQINVSLHNIFS